MAQFVYRGDLAEVDTLGFHFRGDKPTEVTDEAVVAKLRGNKHFTEVFEGVEVLMPEKPKRKYTRRKDA